jgi:hypothetical protein
MAESSLLCETKMCRPSKAVREGEGMWQRVRLAGSGKLRVGQTTHQYHSRHRNMGMLGRLPFMPNPKMARQGGVFEFPAPDVFKAGREKE